MLLAFILLIIFFGLCPKMKIDRVIYAVVVWNAWSYILVEILSCYHRLNRIGIACAWGMLDFILFVSVLAKRKCVVLREYKHFFELLKQKWVYVLPLFLALIVLGLAIVTIPYNWDSMTYHLSRIAYWAQNESVAHYAVEDVRQLSSCLLYN